MIIKSLSRKSNPQQLIKYVLRYVTDEKQKSTDKPTIILKKNLRSSSIEGFLKEFAENERFRLYRRNDSVILYHDILSFHPLSKEYITSAILKDIAKQYIELRGKNNLYLIAHHSANHEHMHCIVSGVQVNGYSSRISKQAFKSLKLNLEKYQQVKYPELDASFIAHDKSHKKSREQIIEAVKVSHQSHKETLVSFLQQEFEETTSKEAFINTLKEHQYKPYYRNDILQGVISNGTKFRFSRLGFTSEKIDSLDKKNEPQQEWLTQLQNLREREPKERLKVIQPKEGNKIAIQIEEQLNELQKLRENNQEHERDLKNSSAKNDTIQEEQTEPMQLRLFPVLESALLNNDE